MLGVQEFVCSSSYFSLIFFLFVLLFYDPIKVGLPGSETVYILIFVQVSSNFISLESDGGNHITFIELPAPPDNSKGN